MYLYKYLTAAMGSMQPRVGWLKQPYVHQEPVCIQCDRSVYVDTVDPPEH